MFTTYDYILGFVGVAAPIYIVVRLAIHSYYYSESVLPILLYFDVLGFLPQLFEDLGAEIYVRIGGILLLSATALVSFLMVGGA